MRKQTGRVHVVLVSGKKQSGKDAAAKVLVKEFGYIKVSFAELLKQTAAAALSTLTNTPVKREWLEKESFKQERILGKYITYREFLQYFGTNFVRKYIDEDFWVQSAANSIIKNVSSKKKYLYVISDVRFPSEIKAFSKIILSAFPDAIITTVRVQRIKRTLLQKMYDKLKEHSSENSLDFYRDWDYILYNYYDLNTYIKIVRSLVHDIISQVGACGSNKS